MCDSEAVGAPPVRTGLFRWSDLAILLAGALVVGAAFAWIGGIVQRGFAPLVLFPLLLGVVVGLTLVGLVRFARIGCRPMIVAAIVLAALIAAAGQHYSMYVSTYFLSPSPAESANKPELSALRKMATPGFGKFMVNQARHGRPLVAGCVARGWTAWLSWIIDAALSMLAAVAVAIPALRVPYCGRCRTWYRTVRGGRIDAATARRLAASLGVEEVGEMRSPRYRLSNCLGGCGPTRCELSWEAGGGIDLVRVWLDAEGRRRVAAILDGLTANP